MAPQEAQMPFIKNLASSDRKLRTASLDSLRTFLSTRRALTRLDALKLWKGLYYAHWMTDRPVAQQRLAADLASLYGALPDGGADAETSNVVVWFAAFWEVLSAQWPHIEALRLDKFLLLVRRIFAAQLAHINSLLLAAGQSRSGDSMASVQQLVDDALAKWCFEPSGDPRSVPLGLRLHVLDIWVDELDAAGLLGTDDEEDGGDNGGEQKKRRGLVVRAVGDLVEALIGCPVKAVRERARESYDDERLPWTTKDPNGDDGAHEDDDGGEWGGIED